MNYTKLNEVLKNLNTLRRGEALERVSNEDNNYNGQTEVYKIDEGVYVKLTIYEDSYGENEAVIGIEFVAPVEVRATNFQPLD